MNLILDVQTPLMGWIWSPKWKSWPINWIWRNLNCNQSQLGSKKAATANSLLILLHFKYNFKYNFDRLGRWLVSHQQWATLWSMDWKTALGSDVESFWVENQAGYSVNYLWPRAGKSRLQVQTFDHNDINSRFISFPNINQHSGWFSLCET